MICYGKTTKFPNKFIRIFGGAIALYGTYSSESIKEIIESINHLHKNLAKDERMLGGRQPNWYKDNIMERRIAHMTLNI